MNRRAALAVGIVVVAAALGFLWLKSRKGDDDAAPSAAKTARSGSGAGAVGDPAGGAATGARSAPEVTGDGDADEDDLPDPTPGGWEADGVPVSRDNRGREPDPDTVRKDRYTVAAPLIRQSRAALRPKVKACQADHADEITTGAKITARLTVSIKSGIMTVTETEVLQSGLPESSALVDCARQAFVGLELAADGHADVERHKLNFPFNLPLR